MDAKSMDRELATMRYGPLYAERVRLEDGTPVRLRLVHRGDRDKLAAGFARLSARSRYLRFFSDHRTLSERDLTFLTEVDQVDHFCIGAALLDDSGHEGEGIGVARFVRDPGRPGLAEAAITVVDAWQRKGLGKILLLRLVEAARERGVKKFRTTLLASNEPVRKLLRGLDPDIDIKGQGEAVTCELPVPARRAILENLGPWNAMRALFRTAAGHLRD